MTLSSQHLKPLQVMFVAVVFLLPTIVQSDTALDRQREALDMIADFADRFCKDIPLVGRGDSVELSGEAKAELSGIVRKLADLGLEGAGKYQNLEYQGLLQKDLIEGLKSSVDCRLKIWNDLKSTLVTETPSAPSKSESKREEYTPLPTTQTKVPVRQPSDLGGFAFYVCKLNPLGDNYLSLRSGPGTSYTEILRMGPNTSLRLMSKQDPWYYVQLRDGIDGWAHSQWICRR